MKPLKTANLKFAIKEFNAETGYVSGYAAVFNTLDWGGDIISPIALDDCIAKHKKDKTNIKIFWCHDQKETIGVWHTATIDEHGLFLEGQLTLEVAKAREVLALINAGAIDGLSIGYYVIKDRFEKEARYLDCIYVYEVSFVPIPMHPNARLVNAKSALPTERDMEKCLREIGLSQKQAKSFLALGYKGISASESIAEQEPQRDVVDSENVQDVVQEQTDPITDALNEDLNSLNTEQEHSSASSDETKSITIEQLQMLSSLF